VLNVFETHQYFFPTIANNKALSRTSPQRIPVSQESFTLSFLTLIVWGQWRRNQSNKSSCSRSTLEGVPFTQLPQHRTLTKPGDNGPAMLNIYTTSADKVSN